MSHALILGASRGLGLGLAKELATRGWSVLGTVRQDEDRDSLEAVGASSALADIADKNSVAALGEHLSEPLDLLFVNAGISEPASFDEIDVDGIGHLFEVNAVAPVRSALALRDHLKPDGTVAFMSSRMGSVSLTNAESKAMYRASKAALNALTRAMAGRFGPRPLLTFHPGWVATDMGGPGADLDVQTSVRGIADVIQERRNKAGSVFLDYSGAELSW